MSGTPRHQFVGGKGGVGKTTCAAAMALSAAARGRRTLLLSTDPASSLADVLQAEIGSTPRTVRSGRTTLHAARVDADGFIRRWIRAHGPVLEQIAVRGTWLDRDDVVQVLRLSLPGIDEIAALLELARFGRSGRYDWIVIDTAPTGHTLRMLQTPSTLGDLARVFEAMQSKHRVMVEALRGSWRADAADAFIEGLGRDARELAGRLSDTNTTEFNWVTLPEPMAVEETIDALAALARANIAVAAIIVNRLTPANSESCAWCEGRRSFEHSAIMRLRAKRPASSHAAPLVAIRDREREPVGLRAVAEIGHELDARRAPGHRSGHGRPRLRTRTPNAETLPDLFGLDRLQLVLFGGKGGVGKTTCAAAEALMAARRSKDRRILLISTDPAHSLSDVFGAPCSDTPSRLPEGPSNLWVRELDASQAYKRVRERYADAVDAFFDGLSRGSAFDAAHDRRVMHGLLDLAPPGIDELVAVMQITDALSPGSSGSFDLVVMDTAPTGHALRLLEMPSLVQEWAKAVMRILLKYQPVVGVGELGELLLQVSRNIGRLRTMLADAERTCFIVVARGERVPSGETDRLLLRLRRMRIPVGGVIVNGVGRGTCARCRRLVAMERREVARLTRAVRQRSRALEIVLTPNEVPPPHGIDTLLQWRVRWVYAYKGKGKRGKGKGTRDKGQEKREKGKGKRERKAHATRPRQTPKVQSPKPKAKSPEPRAPSPEPTIRFFR
jgi:arsenite/tail-anchored protein-transporting ATPase